MKTMNYFLRAEVCDLEKLVKKAKERLRNAPEGHVRIAKKGNRAELYYKGAKDNGGRYMKKHEIGIARAIAQRDYDTQLVKLGEKRIKAIYTFLEKYEKTSLKEIYRKMHPNRRELLDTNIISDEEYIKKWQAVKYEGKAFTDGAPEIITERGEGVRSKSEKIIADKLYALGIPYRYEYPIILDDSIKIYPDFTILKMPAREEVYLEHLGMMDDSDYVENVIRKFKIYERNGIYLGINLFITYETKKYPLNTRMLDGLIRGLFCEETFPFH